MHVNWRLQVKNVRKKISYMKKIFKHTVVVDFLSVCLVVFFGFVDDFSELSSSSTNSTTCMLLSAVFSFDKMASCTFSIFFSCSCSLSLLGLLGIGVVGSSTRERVAISSCSAESVVRR